MSGGEAGDVLSPLTASKPTKTPINNNKKISVSRVSKWSAHSSLPSFSHGGFPAVLGSIKYYFANYCAALSVQAQGLPALLQPFLKEDFGQELNQQHVVCW